MTIASCYPLVVCPWDLLDRQNHSINASTYLNKTWVLKNKTGIKRLFGKLIYQILKLKNKLSTLKLIKILEHDIFIHENKMA